jgi:uncharacterized membrane protein
VRSEKMSSRWERLNSSFSVLPALLTAGAVLLFFVTQHLDQATRTSLESLPILFSGGSSAARSVLSAISGSVITVVATVFSLTIVALQLASSQYSPRVLRNFTSDRGVQLVLGAYIATFLYSLLVLRIIRSPAGATEAFVPKISVTVAILLALACVGLLVYFVSHIATIIQSSTIVQRAHTDAARTIANLEDLDGCPAGEETSEDPPAGDPLVLRAQRSGYVQHVDVEALAEALTGDEAAGKTTVEVPSGPGRFVPAGSTVLKVWPARELTERAEEGAHGALVLGRERSFQGDFAFGLRQLSDIALKGLSPAVNDPTTAMQAMDRMEAIFVALGEKRMPARKREREANGTRVVIMVGHYGFDDVVGLERLLEILELAIRPNEPPDRRRSLWARAFTIGRLSPERVADPEDAARLVARATDVGERLSRDGGGPTVSSDLESLAALSRGLREDPG